MASATTRHVTLEHPSGSEASGELASLWFEPDLSRSFASVNNVATALGQ
jgi:hypothetical protein